MAFGQHQARRSQYPSRLAGGLKARFSVAKRNTTTIGTLCVAAFLFVASSRGPDCFAQASFPPSSNQSSDNPQSSLGLGPIAPGDGVDVQVFDAPELSVRTRVGASGDIAVPLLDNFHIAGLTAPQAARSLEETFKQRQLLLNPKIIVTVQQFGSGVTVVGQVHTPGIYPLLGQRRVVDLIAMAGGLTDRAGHLIEISSPGKVLPTRTIVWDPSLRGTENSDFILEPGQTLLVSACGIVYVGGNVGKPGGYPICGSLHTTVSQAMSIAGGALPSSKSKSLLIRTNLDGTRTTVDLNIHDILLAKAPDIPLQADDILYIPPSMLKASSKIVIQAAVGFATQAFLFLH
jgi:polysaccharide export outer membrane protein